MINTPPWFRSALRLLLAFDCCRWCRGWGSCVTKVLRPEAGSGVLGCCRYSIGLRLPFQAAVTPPVWVQQPAGRRLRSTRGTTRVGSVRSGQELIGVSRAGSWPAVVCGAMRCVPSAGWAVVVVWRFDGLVERRRFGRFQWVFHVERFRPMARSGAAAQAEVGRWCHGDVRARSSLMTLRLSIITSVLRGTPPRSTSRRREGVERAWVRGWTAPTRLADARRISPGALLPEGPGIMSVSRRGSCARSVTVSAGSTWNADAREQRNP